jgi:ABC-type antimicrobial peptide transport system permease subunit
MYNKEKATRGEYPYNLAPTQAPLAPIVKDEIAEVEYVTRIDEGPAIVHGNGKIFNENITSVDVDFFKIFSFPLFRGNADRLFRSSHEAVVTKDLAEKYFGSDNPIGKAIRVKNSFLSEDVSNQYLSYRRWTKIITFSTCFAILIASLGLFGLAGINAVNRTREIGIRKVLGAGLVSIFILLNRQYVGLTLIAFAIAAPFSRYLMNEWLANFKSRIVPDWQIFVLSAGTGILLSVLTVSYHGIKSALINPAESLKHE